MAGKKLSKSAEAVMYTLKARLVNQTCAFRYYAEACDRDCYSSGVHEVEPMRKERRANTFAVVGLVGEVVVCQGCGRTHYPIHDIDANLLSDLQRARNDQPSAYIAWDANFVTV